MIAAGHRLYREQGALPTVADIALAAGVAKGSVYLSFGTKEEIFVALLEDSFAQLLAGLMPVLDTLPAAAQDAAHTFAAAYVQQIGDLPDLVPLAAMTNAVLERNLPIDAMIRFKLGLAHGLADGGARVERRLAVLSPGGGADLLLLTWALTVGLWQALDYPPAIRAHLAGPDLRILERDFSVELAAAVRQFWRGALLPGPDAD